MKAAGSLAASRGPNIVVKNMNSKFNLNERFIKKIVIDTLVILKKSKATKLDIGFISDKAIKPLNKKYRQSDRATDVLSFNLGSCAQILISSDTASRNSKVFGTSFEEEIVLYVIHGILHFFGYEDETINDKKKMSKQENRILDILCAKSDFSKVLTPR